MQHIFDRENKRITLPPQRKAPQDFRQQRANAPHPSFTDFDNNLPPSNSARPLFKTFTINLAVAGQQTMQLGGNVIWFLSSTNATDLINVQYNPDSDPLPFHPGNAMAGPRFSNGEVTLSWSAIAGAVAVMVFGSVPDQGDLRIL